MACRTATPPCLPAPQRYYRRHLFGRPPPPVAHAYRNIWLASPAASPAPHEKKRDLNLSRRTYLINAIVAIGVLPLQRVTCHRDMTLPHTALLINGGKQQPTSLLRGLHHAHDIPPTWRVALPDGLNAGAGAENPYAGLTATRALRFCR